MRDGWRAQLVAGGLSTDHIKASCRTVTRNRARSDAWVAGGRSHAADQPSPRTAEVPARSSALPTRRPLTEVVDGGDPSSRDRAAAILVLVFGQRIEDVSGTDDLVTITLGGFAIELREPLDAPWRSLATNPGNHRTAAHPTGPWVFRGYSPGRHIDAMSLRDRLRRRLVSTRAARLGTLYELTTPAPAASIAEAPGYSPAAIERHVKESGAHYAQYVAAVIDAGPSAAQQAPAHSGGPARQANEQTPGCRGYPGGQPGSRAVQQGVQVSAASAQGVANAGARVGGCAAHGQVSHSSHGVREGVGQVPT